MDFEQSKDYPPDRLIADQLQCNSLRSESHSFAVRDAGHEFNDSYQNLPSETCSFGQSVEASLSRDETETNLDLENLQKLESERRRGHYHIFHDKEKVEILEYTRKNGIQRAVKFFSTKTRPLTARKIKSWQENQGKDKGIKGRKSNDPSRDAEVLRWFRIFEKLNQRAPTRKETQDIAKKVCRDDEFKASKGWLDKFAKKFELDFCPAKMKPSRITIQVKVTPLEDEKENYPHQSGDTVCYSTSATSQENDSDAEKPDFRDEIEFHSFMLNGSPSC